MKITKSVVDKTHVGDKDVWVWDTPMPGFFLRVKPSGVKTYGVQYRDEGRRTRRVTIGRHGVFSAEKARTQAQQLLAAVARGENPAESRAATAAEPTVEDLAARYMAEHATPKKKPKSIADDQQKIDTYIVPKLGSRRVASITREDVGRLHHQLRGKPTQANRTVALLSKMMSLAEAWGMRPPASNPCRGLQKFREKKRDRYLSTPELARLGDAIRAADAEESEPWAALLALRLLLLTGMRLGEVLTLRWENVDLEHGVLRLADSKTGQKTVALGPPAVKLLAEARRREGNPWVCPATYGSGHLSDLKGPWRRIKAAVDTQQDKEQAEGTLKPDDRVKLADLRLHDLRHSFASVGAGAGLSLPLIGALLGHSQPATTARYAHLANDPLRQAAGVVAGHIAAVLEGKEPAEVVNIEEGRK
ncbi:MAG: tyrosine-type recombinase/integrase [Thermoleophilia bacterium]